MQDCLHKQIKFYTVGSNEHADGSSFSTWTPTREHLKSLALDQINFSAVYSVFIAQRCFFSGHFLRFCTSDFTAPYFDLHHCTPFVHVFIISPFACAPVTSFHCLRHLYSPSDARTSLIPERSTLARPCYLRYSTWNHDASD